MEHGLCDDRDDTEFAWSEGFSDYFGTLIVALYPHLEHPEVVIPSIEAVPCINKGDDIELVVAGVLWDLFDTPQISGVDEPFDEVDSLDTIIIQMLDNELDHKIDAPDLCEFYGKVGRRVSPLTYQKISEIFKEYNACT